MTQEITVTIHGVAPHGAVIYSTSERNGQWYAYSDKYDSYGRALDEAISKAHELGIKDGNPIAVLIED